MRTWMFMLAIVGCTLVVGAPLCAQPPEHGQDARATERAQDARATPETQAGRVLAKVLKLFAGDGAAIGEPDLSEAFLKAVPLMQLRQIALQLRGTEGDLTLDTIDEGASEHALVANVIGAKNKTALKIRIGLDDHGKIATLLLQPGIDQRVPALKSWDDLKQRLGAGAARSSFTVREIVEHTTRRLVPDGETTSTTTTTYREIESRVQYHSEEPLAIGSAFKLWVLGALAQAIESGDLGEGGDGGWGRTLKIQTALKSLPSGVMQNEPDGKEFTLRQFAEKMISISDNTATDHLIDRLGRDRCERCMSRCCPLHQDLNKPFLTTRDLFALKLSGSDELPKRYIQAGEMSRRELVSAGGDVGKQEPHAILGAAWKSPRFIDTLEWFASGEDLCATMALLDGLSRTTGLEPVREILAINPGVPIDRKIWAYVGYKGGSEPGVLSLTWLLRRNDRRTFVLSITFNDTKKAIDEGLGVALAQRAVEFLGTFDVAGVK